MPLPEPLDPVEAAVRRVAAAAGGYAAFDDLVAGDHPTRWVDEASRVKFRQVLADARLNVCPGVIDAHADRLAVAGFQSQGAPEGDEDEAAAHAWAIWTRNRMDRRQGELYQEAFRTGDAYLIVWPDPDDERLAAIDPNPAGQVTVWYDDERRGRVSRAAKLWRLLDGRWRLTLYYADRLEKYVTLAPRDAAPGTRADWAPVEPDGEPWPLPNPWGRVPVFHLANNAPLGGFGKSELADVAPIQYRLNKTVLDLMVTSHYQNYRQRWASGVQGMVDPDTGEEDAPFKAGADEVWTVPAPDARFGEFGTADLGQLRELKLEHQVDVSRVSKVPVHYLVMTGDFPSGEALKTAEAPFVAKIADRQVAFGNVFEDALRFALAIEGRPGAALDCRWHPAAPRSEREAWEVAKVQAEVGVSLEQILRENGYTEEQIAAIVREADGAAATAFDRQAAAFGVGAEG